MKQVTDVLQNISEEKNEKIVNNGPSFGARHVQAILLFTGVTTEIMTRTNLSLSIVAMTDHSASVNSNVPTYDWTDTNIILSSFYWGYMAFQVLAGQLGKNYGSRWILFTAMTINALATVLIPSAAETFGSKGVIGCRVLQGLSQGGIFPTCHTMLGRWAPKNEVGKMSTFVYSGINIGTIICLPVTGLISQSSLGWPVSFYLFGGLGFLWSVMWIIFGQNAPASHPNITPEERLYIEVSLSQDKNRNVVPTPWKAMFSSVHFWAMVLPTVFSGYGVIFLQSEIPTYLEKVLKYDISSSGYITSMTAGTGLAVTFIYGPLSDFLIERQYLSRLNTRKFFEALSNYGCAASLVILAFLDERHTYLSVFMFVLSSVFVAGLLFGHGVNPMDISPRFSGIILGFANGVSCIPALSSPLCVQYLVPDLTNAVQWRIVLLIASLTLVIPGTFFLIFASADRQWWDDGPQRKDTSDKEPNSDSKDFV